MRLKMLNTKQNKNKINTVCDLQIYSSYFETFGMEMQNNIDMLGFKGN